MTGDDELAPEPPAPEPPGLELLELLGEELAGGGVDASVVEASDGVPAQLVVPLDGPDGATVVHLCFLPEHSTPAVLQLVVALDVDVDPAAFATVARVLHLVNTAIPVTGFELGESLRGVLFRLVHPVDAYPLDVEVVAWSLSMVFHAVVRYQDVVTRACRGASVEELLPELARLQADA